MGKEKKKISLAKKALIKRLKAELEAAGNGDFTPVRGLFEKFQESVKEIEADLLKAENGTRKAVKRIRANAGFLQKGGKHMRAMIQAYIKHVNPKATPDDDDDDE